MKHLSATVIFIMFCLPLMAQDNTQGKINYKIRVNVHASLKPDQLQYKDVIPEFIDQEAVFLFKGRHGLVKSSEGGMEEKEGDVSVQVKMGNENGVTYVDMDTKQNLQLVKVGDKEYLFSGKGDNGGENNVKLDIKGKEIETGETRKILGYDCKKVIAGSGKDKVVYWYTTTLPILGGALGFMSGKGLVLEMESPVFSFKATSVQFQQVADADVLPPKGLKTISDMKDAK
ncbi:GLPGLI family protein [Chitinophaga niabensis]|uniref:GLPGLI family protein n=1 Tax=Chitinophaga niabensis TaxID=536979 RepID=A0A1N6DAL0_9BACT|nr:GLPGLI family protein [Chitinophaga niabensis]SIN67861.1 GLPGLI family protein [Chitinophaga niabensis]